MRQPDRPKAGQIFRCAIYTRKSSEEGLQEEFNSLLAQHETSEAFINSQRHEGWVCLRAAYDADCAHITGGAVLEYGPTEILPPLGPMLPRSARLSRPRRSPRPAHPRKTAASRRRKANSRERQVRT